MSNILWVQIDDGIKLNSDEGYYLDEPLEGFDLPNIRTSSFDLSGRDGGIVARQFYGMRAITLTGRIWDYDGAALAARRRALQEAVAKKSVTLRLFTYDGAVYQIECNVIDFKMPILRTPNLSGFKIELVAPDPLIYDYTEGSIFEAYLTKVTGSGYPTPYLLPIAWPAGGIPANIVNSGATTVYPVITLTNIGSNPKITNVDAAEVIQYMGGIGTGDQLVIDMAKRTVTLNGSNVRALLSNSSTFWGLKPGDNLLKLESDGGADTVTGYITWRPGFWGI